MINELSGGVAPPGCDGTHFHSTAWLPLLRLFTCGSGLAATTQAKILLALPLSQSHSPTHSKTQSQSLPSCGLSPAFTLSKYNPWSATNRARLTSRWQAAFECGAAKTDADFSKIQPVISQKRCRVSVCHWAIFTVWKKRRLDNMFPVYDSPRAGPSN